MSDNNSMVMRKRIFVGLLGISMMLLVAFFVAVFWFGTNSGLLINRIIKNTIEIVAIFLLLYLGIGLISLIWSIWSSKSVILLPGAMKLATKLLFPISIIVGKILGWNEDRIKNSYIQVSNHLVMSMQLDDPVQNILILVPHCIQWIHCPYKITIDINNCRKCGRCQIGELIEMSKRYNVALRVVTGGTIARKAVKETRPGAIIAIACERDLTSGIKDIKGIPVIGVINDRPEGPCCNTCVDIIKVEEAIKFFRKEV